MDTETPPDPRGVPHEVAVRTLTAPELIAAYQAVRDAPIPEAAVVQRQNGMMRQELDAEGTRRSGRGGGWLGHARSAAWFDDWRHGDNGPGSAVHERRRAERIALQAKNELVAEQIQGPREALEADFQHRVRDGRIIASWIDLTSPADGARDYPGEVAALIVWQGNRARLGRSGPVLTDLRYRRAAGEVAPAPLVYPAHAPKGGSGNRYTAKALGAWFVHREGTWKIENPEAPYPNRAQDLAAADSYFSGRIPPDEFRRIRKEKTSEDWRKRGPRGPFPKPSSDE